MRRLNPIFCLGLIAKFHAQTLFAHRARSVGDGIGLQSVVCNWDTRVGIAELLQALLIWPVCKLKLNVVWSLRHELLFYAIFALAILAPRQRPWILGRSVLALWFDTPVLLWPLLYQAGFTLSLTPSRPVELMSVVLLGAWSGANQQLGVGFALGLAALQQSRLMRPRNLSLEWAAAAVVIVAVLAETLALPIGLARSLVWTILAIVLIWLSLVAIASDGWLARVGTVLRDASFAIYLVHNTVILVLFNLVSRLHHWPPAIPFLITATLVAVTAGIAAHRFIEQPVISACTASLRPGRARPKAAIT